MENHTAFFRNAVMGMVFSLRETEDRFSQEARIFYQDPVVRAKITRFRQKHGIDQAVFKAKLRKMLVYDFRFKESAPSRAAKPSQGRIPSKASKRKLAASLAKSLTLSALAMASPEGKARKRQLAEFSEEIHRLISFINSKMGYDDLVSLLRSWRLSEEWAHPIMVYIWTGRIEKPDSRCWIMHSPATARGNRRLLLWCSWWCSIEDFRGMWSLVKEAQGNLPQRGIRKPKVLVKGSLLYVELFKETTQKDVLDVWSEIDAARPQLIGFQSVRPRHKKNFERDAKLARGRAGAPGSYEVMEEYLGGVDHPKTRNKNLTTMRKAKQRFKLQQKKYT